MLLAAAQRGQITDEVALNDRVSRGVAWRLAREHGWPTTFDAEYLAVCRLQADALVTIDPGLASLAEGIVPLASTADLVARH